MKKILIILIILMSISLWSCQKEISKTLEPNKKVDESTAGRLVFTSQDQLDKVLGTLKNIDGSPSVKSTAMMDIPSDFISLVQRNYDLLRAEVTDEEFAIATAEGLEIDFEDEVIADEYFAQVLNFDREIQIGQDIFKFIPKGILMTDVANANKLTLPIVDDVIPDKVKFIPNDYRSEKEFPVTKSAGTDLILYDNTVISSADVRDGVYGGRGDASAFQYWLSNKFLGGINTVVEHHFDARHRMKLRVYAQNYVLYEVVGTTCRMQKRLFRIWWRIKAQEMRVGWSAIQIGYKFKQETSLNIPKKPANTSYMPELPKWYKTKFPFKNEEYVIFRAPFDLYDLKVGDVNAILKDGVRQLGKEFTNTLISLNKSTTDLKNIGLFTSRTSEVINLIGANEKSERNTGREVQDFYLQWFSGTFQIGYSMSSGGVKWSDFSVSVDKTTKVELKRGVVYGAVKWGGKWKAARISVNN